MSKNDILELVGADKSQIDCARPMEFDKTAREWGFEPSMFVWSYENRADEDGKERFGSIAGVPKHIGEYLFTSVITGKLIKTQQVIELLEKNFITKEKAIEILKEFKGIN